MKDMSINHDENSIIQTFKRKNFSEKFQIQFQKQFMSQEQFKKWIIQIAPTVIEPVIEPVFFNVMMILTAWKMRLII